jgi:cell division protein FtsW
MTLPFISYGGSSLMTSGITIGLLIALTRHRQHREAPSQPKPVAKADHGEAYG